MKYKLHYTDRRHRYHPWFFCYISFSKHMGQDVGPLNFCKALDWFTEKYGTSSEVRQWQEMKDWQVITKRVASATNAYYTNDEVTDNIEKYVNPHWSWSNGTEDLRIYISSEKELSFFHLSFS